MRVVAVASQKGGSGRTTTAVNLAAALAEQGHGVLPVDFDAQASASSWLGCFRDLTPVTAGRTLEGNRSRGC